MFNTGVAEIGLFVKKWARSTIRLLGGRPRAAHEARVRDFVQARLSLEMMCPGRSARPGWMETLRGARSPRWRARAMTLWCYFRVFPTLTVTKCVCSRFLSQGPSRCTSFRRRVWTQPHLRRRASRSRWHPIALRRHPRRPASWCCPRTRRLPRRSPTRWSACGGAFRRGRGGRRDRKPPGRPASPLRATTSATPPPATARLAPGRVPDSLRAGRGRPRKPSTTASSWRVEDDKRSACSRRRRRWSHRRTPAPSGVSPFSATERGPRRATRALVRSGALVRSRAPEDGSSTC